MTPRPRLLSLVGGILLLSVALSLGDVIDVVNSVSQASYTNYLTAPNFLYTHNGNDRWIWGADHDPAGTNIFNTFQSFGLSTSYFSGTTPPPHNTPYDNVVGVKLGALTPDNIYIVGAHYDSVNNPGADDDASGVAGLLEAARVLSQYTFAATLIFIAFDTEELGLIGSQYYANAHAGDNILGMVQMDMIAYNPVGPTWNTALIYGRAASNPLKTALAAAVNTYGGGIVPSIQGQLDASDHAPFEWVGKQAALLIEGAVWTNPHYHQPTDSVDTPGYLDYAYATNMTRAVVGYIAGAAGLLEDQGQIPEPNCAVLLIIVAVARLARRRR